MMLLWCGKLPQPQVKNKKFAITALSCNANPPPNGEIHAETVCNQLPIATATATKPQIHLENDAIKVGYNKPR
jgi:hypothetical protein